MQKITAEELQDMMSSQSDNDLLLINVLKPKDFREQHIPGSVNVPVSDEGFVNEVKKIAGSKDRMIVVYCANVDCTASPRAAEKLEDAGFGNIYDFEGGVKEWEESAGRLQRAA